jgi:FeS assembly SUF system regulator
MLRVSRLTDYATVVMTCLASRPDTVSSTAEIAACTRLEAPTVSKLAKRLARAGLIESFRGTHGGYRLARPAAEINLAEIVEALEGPLGMTECSAVSGQCDFQAHCNMRGNWQHINHAVDGVLKAMSLADMLRPASDRISPLHG